MKRRETPNDNDSFFDSLEVFTFEGTATPLHLFTRAEALELVSLLDGITDAQKALAHEIIAWYFVDAAPPPVAPTPSSPGDAQSLQTYALAQRGADREDEKLKQQTAIERARATDARAEQQRMAALAQCKVTCDSIDADPEEKKAARATYGLSLDAINATNRKDLKRIDAMLAKQTRAPPKPRAPYKPRAPKASVAPVVAPPLAKKAKTTAKSSKLDPDGFPIVTRVDCVRQSFDGTRVALVDALAVLCDAPMENIQYVINRMITTVTGGFGRTGERMFNKQKFGSSDSGAVYYVTIDDCLYLAWVVFGCRRLHKKDQECVPLLSKASLRSVFAPRGEAEIAAFNETLQTCGDAHNAGSLTPRMYFFDSDASAARFAHIRVERDTEDYNI
jgi:hypothetical protein